MYVANRLLQGYGLNILGKSIYEGQPADESLRMTCLEGSRCFDDRATCTNNYGRSTEDAYRTVPKQNIVVGVSNEYL
ncbi:MAG: hypothetical protein ACLVIY_01515 [Anaerobutyricum soehngenii]